MVQMKAYQLRPHLKIHWAFRTAGRGCEHDRRFDPDHSRDPDRRHDRGLDCSLIAAVGVMFLSLLQVLGLTACGSPIPVKEDQYFSLVQAPTDRLPTRDQSPLSTPDHSPPSARDQALLPAHDQPPLPVRDQAPPTASNRAPIAASLQVNELSARGFLGGRQILFRTEEAPRQTQRYDHLLWDEPVPRALSRQLAASIRDARLFRFVLIPADRGRADYLLGGEVERFEHLPTASPPRMVGTLNLTLIRASDGRPLLERRHDAEEIVAGPTPADMATAASHLANRLAAEVVADLRTWRVLTAPQPVSPPASSHP